MVGAHFQRVTEEAAGWNMTGTKLGWEKKTHVFLAAIPHLIDSSKHRARKAWKTSPSSIAGPRQQYHFLRHLSKVPLHCLYSPPAMELQPPPPTPATCVCPTCLHSPKVFSKLLIWISYVAIEATSIPAHHGPGDQINSVSLLGLSCT